MASAGQGEFDVSAGAESSAVRDALEESELLLNVYRAVVETADLKTGLRAALEKVCAYTGWIIGSAWLPTEDAANLALYSSWHPAEPELDEFIGQCRGRAFELGGGLIGSYSMTRVFSLPSYLRNRFEQQHPLALSAASASSSRTAGERRQRVFDRALCPSLPIDRHCLLSRCRASMPDCTRAGYSAG